MTSMFSFDCPAKNPPDDPGLSRQEGDDSLRILRPNPLGVIAALVNPQLILDLPATPGPNHDGGTMTFGPDGKLYVVIGDLNRNGQLQNFSSGPDPDNTSAIFRINEDGSAPADNPFSAQPGLAKYYPYGIRTASVESDRGTSSRDVLAVCFSRFFTDSIRPPQGLCPDNSTHGTAMTFS